MEKDYKERFFRLLNAVNNISDEMLEAHLCRDGIQ